jgi:hypothetical protein
LVPAPTTARVGGQQLRDRPLLDWCRELLDALGELSPAAPVSSSF